MAADLDKLDREIAQVASRVRAARRRPAAPQLGSGNDPGDGPGVLDVIEDLGVTERVRELINASKAPSTAKAYAMDWAGFSGWCVGRRVRALPASPGTVADFVASLVDDQLAVATINRRLAAIAYVHEAQGHLRPTRHPLVAAAVSGATRTIGEDQRRARPITLDLLRAMCARRFVLSDPVHRRDRALLTIGWAAALRCSEIVGLDVSDITLVDEAPGLPGLADTGVPAGMIVRLSKGSKTNQTRKREEVVVPAAHSTLICPVRAVQWQIAQVISGPLFRSAHHDRRLTAEYPGDLVKALTAELKIDPSDYTSHSLRAGFVTEMRARGVPDHLIARQTRHKNLAMLRIYDRPTDALAPSASALAGQDWW